MTSSPPLPAAVYTALDATIGMTRTGDMRMKYLETCCKSSIASLLDFTIAAPFHHLTSLFLDEGAHFYPLNATRTSRGWAAPLPHAPTV